MKYAPGQRVIIRDAQWKIRRVDILADDEYNLHVMEFQTLSRVKNLYF